jgi:hypothetical protein
MTPEERAKRLVGDMPWVTERLTPAQITDLPKQIEASIFVAVEEEREACAAAAEKLRGYRTEGHEDTQEKDKAFGRGVDMAAYCVAQAIRARKHNAPKTQTP